MDLSGKSLFRDALMGFRVIGRRMSFFAAYRWPREAAFRIDLRQGRYSGSTMTTEDSWTRVPLSWVQTDLRRPLGQHVPSAAP